MYRALNSVRNKPESVLLGSVAVSFLLVLVSRLYLHVSLSGFMYDTLCAVKKGVLAVTSTPVLVTPLLFIVNVNSRTLQLTLPLWVE